MSVVSEQSPLISYFVGPPLGGRWKRSIVRKYGQKAELDIFSREGDKGLKSFEKSFLLRHLQRKGRILDLGCGAGREALPLARLGHDVVGVDLTPAMVTIASKKAKEAGIRADFQVGEAGNLEFPVESFDYALMMAQFIHHFHGRNNRLQALREAWRVLRPGGLLILQIRNQLGLTWAFVANFLYRRVKGIPPLQSENNGSGDAYPVYAPRLWRNGIHGLHIRILSLGVDTWRRAAMGLKGAFGLEYEGREPGDYLLPSVSPAISAGCAPFHSYSLRELTADLGLSGFTIQEVRDTVEVDAGVDFPGWVRKGARHLLICCKKVHRL